MSSPQAPGRDATSVREGAFSQRRNIWGFGLGTLGRDMVGTTALEERLGSAQQAWFALAVTVAVVGMYPVFAVILGVTDKASSALASGVVGLLTAAGVTVFKAAMMGLPMVLVVVSWVVLARTYRLDEATYGRLLADLVAREAALGVQEHGSVEPRSMPPGGEPMPPGGEPRPPGTPSKPSGGAHGSH